MKRLAYAKKRDANEPEIVDALQKAGCYVHRLDDPVDLLVSKPGGKVFQIEVKTPKGKLTPAQVDYIADSHAPVHVVTSPEEALEVVSR